MQATFLQESGTYDYTPAADVAAGAVVIVGNLALVAKRDIEANTLGALHGCGLFKVVKDASVFAAGDEVYWNPTGDPVGGTAGTGAATLVGPYYLGTVPPAGAALTGDATVQVDLDPERRSTWTTTATVAATGSTQTDAAQLGEGFTLVTAADATKGVKLPAAAAGKRIEIKNGAAAILKIYPATGDAINALSANAAFSIAASTSVVLVAYDATTWYSIPLLPS
jgi:predicted RecA/RadA family phage recombinase